MTDRDALLAAVCDRPDDDTPRLVFADWCDDHGDPDYARFIRAQIDLARVPEWDRLRVRAWHRERGLVTGLPYQNRYSVPYLTGSFRRGFPWGVEYPTPALFADATAGLFATAPVQSVAIRSDYRAPPPDLTPLATDPRLTRLRRLAFSLSRLGADAIRALADAPHLGEVTELRFEFAGLSAEGMEDLFQSGLAGRMTRLRLHSNEGNLSAVLRQFNGASSLRALTLSDSSLYRLDPAVIRSCPLFRGLVELDLFKNRLGPTAVAALAESPAADTLESLNLSWTEPGVPGVRALAGSAALANLRRLHLGTNDLGPVAVTALARSPHLRNLAVLDLGGNAIGDKGALALAASPYLRNLIDLDLMHARLTDHGVAALLDSPVTANLEHLGLNGDQSISPEMRARVRERLRVQV